jgi:spore germination cell wall hydrolase CwlJ-like protein
MIRIFKILTLATVLTVGTAQAEEASVISQIQSQAETTLNAIVNSLINPFFSDKDIECLARNIYYEAGSESEEGKVAVGMVTLNRMNSGRYPDTVCGVVQQKTVLSVPKKTTIERKELFKTTVEVQTTWVQKVVCQFSWNCLNVKKIKQDDPRWQESQRVARELTQGGFEEYRAKYADAMHFHAVYVNPGWKLKRITRVGNHIFYQ